MSGIVCRFCKTVVQEDPSRTYRTDGICEVCERKIGLLIRDVPDPGVCCAERSPSGTGWCDKAPSHVDQAGDRAHAVNLKDGRTVAWEKVDR